MSCDLLPGDVFCVRGNMGVVSALIRGVEKFWSYDNEAIYGHSGIITSASGDTIEALWTVRRSHLDEYIGDQIIIARPTMKYPISTPITADIKKSAIAEIEKHLGRIYPVWRLPMFLFPPLAKYLSLGRWLACSELTGKDLVLVGARQPPYSGLNPDTLADEWRKSWNYATLFEGIWGSAQ